MRCLGDFQQLQSRALVYRILGQLLSRTVPARNHMHHSLLFSCLLPLVSRIPSSIGSGSLLLRHSVTELAVADYQFFATLGREEN